MGTWAFSDREGQQMGRRWWGVLLGLGLAAATTVSAAPADAAIPASPRLRPPVVGRTEQSPGVTNFPDPAVLRAEGQWWAFSTNSLGADPRNIGVIRSDDLWSWTAPDGSAGTGEALRNPPAWARSLDERGSFWAPSAIRIGGQYFVYFAARHRDIPPDRSGWCIGAAIADDPAGPYRARGRPVVCRVLSHDRVSRTSRQPARNEGLIDPFVYRAPNGRLFLLVKPLDRGWQLQSIPLHASGLYPSERAHGLLYLDGDVVTWEREGEREWSSLHGFSVLENPAMDYNASARSTGRPYLLFYAGGEWRSRGYSTGFATCRTPRGPCRKVTTTRPWLASTNGVSGPGGFSVFRGESRQRWAAYHSWAPGGVANGQGRRLHVEPLRYDGRNPMLQNRRPLGSFEAAAGEPGQVTFTGWARDKDSARPVRIAVRELGVVLTRTETTDGTYTVTLEGVTPGEHRYCATIRDDHVGPNLLPPCRRVTVT